MLPRAFPKAPARDVFAYPAQSNFSGVQHPLDLIDEAQQRGLEGPARRGCVRADQSPRSYRCLAHFVPLSFYKMFGYPTGVGALIARRESLARLRRPWFAGGTITLASVQR